MTFKTIFKTHANFSKSEIWDTASSRICISNFSVYLAVYVLKMFKKKFDDFTIFHQKLKHEWSFEGNFC